MLWVTFAAFILISTRIVPKALDDIKLTIYSVSQLFCHKISKLEMLQTYVFLNIGILNILSISEIMQIQQLEVVVIFKGQKVIFGYFVPDREFFTVLTLFLGVILVKNS